MSDRLALFLTPLLGGTSVLLFVIVLLSPRNRVVKRLAAIRARSSTPRASGVSRVVEHLLSEQQRLRIEGRLQEAGWYRTTAGDMVFRSTVGATVGISATLLVSSAVRMPPLEVALLFAILGTAGAYAPFRQLNDAIAKRKGEINRSLTEFLDLVATMVRAGLGLNAALGNAVDAAEGALRDEMIVALSEIRLGRSRSDALNAMSERVRQSDLTMAIQVIVQAEQLGANISDALAQVADEAWNYRLRRAEEEAARLPIRMMRPMAFFMVPAIYVVIITAAVANYMLSQ